LIAVEVFIELWCIILGDLKVSGLAVIVLFWFVVFRLESGDERVVLSNGLVLHHQQCLSTFGPAWLEAIADFGASLRRHAIDISTLACMAALALITCMNYFSIH